MRWTQIPGSVTYQTIPYPGQSWRPEGEPARQPHEYLRDGTAKVLTLFHPADGQVRLEGVTACPNAVLHPWLKRELTADPGRAARARRPSRPRGGDAAWERWQEGLTIKPTLLAELPPLRMLLVLDNLAGHKTPAFVCWLFAHGIMPLYTPVGGSWLNMAESLQRILKRRALDAIIRGSKPDHSAGTGPATCRTRVGQSAASLPRLLALEGRCPMKGVPSSWCPWPSRPRWSAAARAEIIIRYPEPPDNPDGSEPLPLQISGAGSTLPSGRQFTLSPPAYTATGWPILENSASGLDFIIVRLVNVLNQATATNFSINASFVLDEAFDAKASAIM